MNLLSSDGLLPMDSTTPLANSSVLFKSHLPGAGGWTRTGTPF
jgi:hypothetical protein